MTNLRFCISIFQLFLNYLTCDNINRGLHHFFKGVEVEFFLLRELNSLYLEAFAVLGVLLEIFPARESVKAPELIYDIKLRSRSTFCDKLL